MNRAASSQGPITLYDLKAPSDRLSQMRRIPEIVAGSLRLVWQAGRRQFMAVTGLQFAAAIAISLQLVIGREILQSLMALGNTGETPVSLAPEFGLLIGGTLLTGVLGALAAHQQRLLTELVSNDALERIIDVASEVELASFENPIFYDQLQRARTSGSTKPVEIVGSVSGLVMSLLTTTGIGITLFMMHPLLLIFILVSGIPVLLSTLYNSRQAYEFEYLWTPRNRERGYLLDLLTGKRSATEIRVFGATRFLRRRFDALTAERISRLRDFLLTRLRVSLAGAAGASVGVVLALGSLVWLVVTGRVDVATAVTAGVAMQLIYSRVSGITRALGSLVEAGMFLDDYHAFLGLGEAEISERTRASRAPTSPATVGFEGLDVEHVSFTYPNTERQVLEDVSLRLRPGEIVALVGENGSGKTTLVKLICSLYTPQSGRILWNGMDAGDLDPATLRSDITVIFQDYLQYHLSALENIALGRVDLDIDPDEVEGPVVEAAIQSGAHGFLSQLPRGYRTRLGRQFYGGYELSVGQWQRLALARAFYRGGGFLILDEPTAALDPRAENELFQQMHALSEGRSVLLISHRFSSVRSADRIYVLDSGRIIESGTHDELMAQGGHYADLFSLQAAAYLGEVPVRSASVTRADPPLSP